MGLNEKFFKTASAASATLLANYTFNNTLASTGGTLGTLQKSSASYVTGRFGNAISFGSGATMSETSTTYGNIWTAMTRSNFVSGSASIWFKAGAINRRNIILYNEKVPYLGLELGSNNQLYIGDGTDNHILSGTTFGTNDVVFACVTAERTNGAGNTQTCTGTLYTGVAGGTLSSVTGSGTTSNNTNTNFCFGHAVSSVGFGGWIDQTRFYDGVLDASEVQALYTE
tara:strand:- start:49 stop:729 length:681 start_codon:yes stop_codon:yes gene_type:complete